MNILWIYDKRIDPELGGTERVTTLIMDGLRSRGHNVVGTLIFDQNFRNNTTFNGLKVLNLLDFLKEKKIDIVINQIAYDSWLIDTFELNGGNSWKKLGGIIVSCLHFNPQYPTVSLVDLFIDWKKLTLYRKLKRLIRITLYPYYYVKVNVYKKKLSYKKVYDKSDFYVLLSKTFVNSFTKIAEIKNDSKIICLPNPLTFNDGLSEKELEDKEKIILVVSRMDESQKKISRIIKSWEFISKRCISLGWSLVIVGDGKWLNFYKEMVGKRRLKGIYFEGQKSPRPYYLKASIFLMTSSKNCEGWGLTITESMQCGVVPVIVNNSSVFSDILENEKSGFLVPNNIKIFCSKIMLLIEDNELRKIMALNALEKSKEFKLDEIIDKWEINILSKVDSNNNK